MSPAPDNKAALKRTKSDNLHILQRNPTLWNPAGIMKRWLEMRQVRATIIHTLAANARARHSACSILRINWTRCLLLIILKWEEKKMLCLCCLCFCYRASFFEAASVLFRYRLWTKTEKFRAPRSKDNSFKPQKDCEINHSAALKFSRRHKTKSRNCCCTKGICIRRNILITFGAPMLVNGQF